MWTVTPCTACQVAAGSERAAAQDAVWSQARAQVIGDEAAARIRQVMAARPLLHVPGHVEQPVSGHSESAHRGRRSQSRFHGIAQCGIKLLSERILEPQRPASRALPFVLGGEATLPAARGL